MTIKEIRYYLTANGKSPFAKWLSEIKDPIIRSRIRRRLERVELGHYGDYKMLGDGICELRLVFGSGYRIYFGEQDNTIILHCAMWLKLKAV